MELPVNPTSNSINSQIITVTSPEKSVVVTNAPTSIVETPDPSIIQLQLTQEVKPTQIPTPPTVPEIITPEIVTSMTTESVTETRVIPNPLPQLPPIPT